ncbi:MAG TPA: Os1348 family NHLP clan protein [Chloroflexota bacterium]|nr:Os1348 family NHLP clan protein [Chloroflexota bacterium]
MFAYSHERGAGVLDPPSLPAYETLRPGLERLIGAALVDPVWRHHLLGDPAGAVRAFGLSDAEAAMVAHIRAADLPGFVSSLRPLISGTPPRARMAG